MAVSDKLKSILSSGIGSIGSSVIGSISGNATVNNQLKAQAEENRRNREYNLMLARQQNQWNLAQWQRENDYNSPTSQMSRLRSAGLNPDLMYGQGTTGNSMGSPTLTSGAPGQAQDMSPMANKRNFGTAVQDALNIEMQRAQIDNIKADTTSKSATADNTIESTNGLTIDNMYKAAQNDSVLRMQDMTVQLGKSALSLNESQLNVMRKQLDEIDTRIAQNKENLSLIKSQVDVNKANIGKITADIDNSTKLARGQLVKWMYDNRESLSRSGLISAQTAVTENSLNEAVATFCHRFYGIVADNVGKDASNQRLELGVKFDQMNNDKFRFDLSPVQYRHDIKNYDGDNIFGRFASAVLKFAFDGLLGEAGTVVKGIVNVGNSK